MISTSSLLASITSNQNQTSEEESTSDEQQSLDSVPTKRTVSDVINRIEATEALPGNWKLKFDLTFNQSGKLTEIAIIHHPSQLVEYHLEATATYEPLAETRVSVEHANSVEEHLTTTSELKEAYNAVKRHIKKLEQQTQEPTEAEWNSASPDSITGPNPSRSPASI